jgi:hypothetical protein
MKTVHKYVLPVEDEVTFAPPAGAQLLHVAEQQGDLCLWALVDPSRQPRLRHLRIAGTGHEIDGSPSYIGTAHLHGGRLVIHVFEVTKHG